MPPQVILRVADHRPYELQDLLPSDTRFKVLLFVGNVSGNEDKKANLETLAGLMGGETGFLSKWVRKEGGEAGIGEAREAFEVLSVLTGSKLDVNYTDVPKLFRSHWSKYVCYPLLMHLCQYPSFG